MQNCLKPCRMRPDTQTDDKERIDLMNRQTCVGRFRHRRSGSSGRWLIDQLRIDKRLRRQRPRPWTRLRPTGSTTFTGGAIAAGIGHLPVGQRNPDVAGIRYPFSIRGLSVIDVGILQVSATGTVVLAQCSRLQWQLRLRHGGCDGRRGRLGKRAAQSERCDHRKYLHLAGAAPDLRAGRHQHHT